MKLSLFFGFIFALSLFKLIPAAAIRRNRNRVRSGIVPLLSGGGIKYAGKQYTGSIPDKYLTVSGLGRK